MDVQITDARALRRVTPVVLSTYLGTQGWVRQDAWKNRIVVWSRNFDEVVGELLVPLREQSDAYSVRISEILALLAQLEGRSQLDVYYDLVGAGANVIRLRSLNGEEKADWSLSDSAELLARTRDLMVAAARAAENPGRPVYHGRLSGTVQDYVRGIRPIPGYEKGYDLTLHSPVPAHYGLQQDMGDPFWQPFARQVTHALKTSLSEAASTAEAVLGGADIASFENVTKQGVSANLCEAVAGLARQRHGVEVTVSWASVRPSDISETQFTFAESVADVFTGGADLLRQKHPFLDVQVIGEIVRLDRQSQEEFDGDALVLGELDGRMVALKVQFDKNDREEVVRAFQHNLPIRVSGNIYREGRGHQLRDPFDFVVIG